MTFGLHITNASGEVLIDGELPCAFLHEKRSVVATCSRRSTGSDSTDFRQIRPAAILFHKPVTTPEPPFIAGYADGRRLAMGTLLGGPGNWEGFTVFHTRDLNGDLAPASLSVNYAVFSREGELRSSDAYGFVAYDAAGRQIFDSRKFPFILRGSFAYDLINNGGQFGGKHISRDKREISGEVRTAPGSNYWPVLSGLNQVEWATPDELYSSMQGGAFCKLSVERESSTQWRYAMGACLIFNGGFYDPYAALPDWEVIDNLGGGLGGMNMFLWAQVPP